MYYVCIGHTHSYIMCIVVIWNGYWIYMYIAGYFFGNNLSTTWRDSSSFPKPLHDSRWKYQSLTHSETSAEGSNNITNENILDMELELRIVVDILYCRTYRTWWWRWWRLGQHGRKHFRPNGQWPTDRPTKWAICSHCRNMCNAWLVEVHMNISAAI